MGEKRWQDLTLDDFDLEEMMKNPDSYVEIEDREVYQNELDAMTDKEIEEMMNAPIDDEGLRLLNLTREELAEMKREEEK
jgi:hypothetical protein